MRAIIVGIGAAGLLSLMPAPRSADSHPQDALAAAEWEVQAYRAAGFEGAETPFSYGAAPRALPLPVAREAAAGFVAAHPDAVVELCPFRAGTPYLWGGGHDFAERTRRCERYGRGQ